MKHRVAKICAAAAISLAVAAAAALLAAGTASAAGPGQPVVELQQNNTWDLTYPSRFTSTKISGTDPRTKQEYKFQRQREGKNFSYVVAGLQPLTDYFVELSFVEHDFSKAGSRVFNVYAQGSKVISLLDVFKSVGKNAACQRTVTARANTAGLLTVNFRSDQTGGRDYATVSTVRLYKASGTTVEISAWESRNIQSPPARLAASGSRDFFESILGRMGARFSLNLVPQRLAARFNPLGDGTGDLHDLVMSLSDGANVRALPFTDRYPVWENLRQSQTMTGQRFECSSAGMPISLDARFTAPFYPQDEKLSSAPFVYIDVTVRNDSAAAVSPTFTFARPLKRQWASSSVTEFSTATESGVRNTASYSYFDESLNTHRAKSATEALAVPADEAGDVDFRGSQEVEFNDFTSDTLWGSASPAGYPATYNDPKRPTFTFYPRGYTGAIWTVPELAPGESVTKQFILAGYVADKAMKVSNTAYSDDSFRFRYRTLFGNVTDVITYAVTSRRTGEDIQGKTEFFDRTIFSDDYLSLPAGYCESVRNIIAFGFQSFLSNTWWMRSDAGRDWFSVWEGSSCRFHSTIDVEYNDAWFFFSYWPGLLKTVMSEWVLYPKTCQQGKYLSHDMGVMDMATGQAYGSDMAVEENANFILLLYKYYKNTGDLNFVKQQFGLVSELVDFMINCDENGNGLPDLYTQTTLDQGDIALQRGKEGTYLGVKCLSAYQAVRELSSALGKPDTATTRKCRGQVELINQTLEYEMFKSDHFVTCADENMPPSDRDAYNIYAGNGLVYLLSGTRSAGVTSGNIQRLKADVTNATARTLKEYGCTHSSYDKHNQWVSQNMWRDMLACQLGARLAGDNPLALSSRYWALERFFSTTMHGTFWDVVVYPGGKEPGTGAGASGAFPGLGLDDEKPASGRGMSGAAGTDYLQSLGYYPRGAAALGLLGSVAGLTVDKPGDRLYYQETLRPMRIPVFERANWGASNPESRVPTAWFKAGSGAPVFTNRALLPSKVAARNMKDITGMTAGTHAISPGSASGATATVRYTLPVAARVTASIWSGSRLVKSFPAADLAAGARSFTWNGLDSSGKVVEDGTYTAKVDAVSKNSTYEIRPASVPIYVNRSVPGLSTTWYLAEGFTGRNATGGEFEQYVLIANPNDRETAVEVAFMTSGGQTVTRSCTVPARSRFTITVDEILPDAELSTMVTSVEPICVERAMYFNNRRAGHNSIGVTSPEKTWYLAEGYTDESFDEYVLVQNPGDTPGNVKMEFMTPGDYNVTRQYVVGPRSRFTVHVDDILPAMHVSTQVDSDVPIVVERAQYLNHMTSGTSSIGACSPSTTWYLAEGYTDQGFEEYVLVQNPQNTYNHITVTFMERSGANTIKRWLIGPKTRFTIGVDNYLPASEVSVKVTASSPVLVERAMYWNNRSDGHASIGTPTPDSDWYLAEGYTAQGFETWVLIQNPTDTNRRVEVTFMEPGGVITTRVYQVAALSRHTVWMNELVPDREAAVRVSADGPVIVERAMYFNDRSGGTNSIGVRGH